MTLLIARQHEHSQSMGHPDSIEKVFDVGESAPGHGDGLLVPS